MMHETSSWTWAGEQSTSIQGISGTIHSDAIMPTWCPLYYEFHLRHMLRCLFFDLSDRSVRLREAYVS